MELGLLHPVHQLWVGAVGSEAVILTGYTDPRPLLSSPQAACGAAVDEISGHRQLTSQPEANPKLGAVLLGLCRWNT